MHPLYSIGHGTRPISSFIELLKKFNISHIADLRSTPFSKHNPQYNRPPLVMALEKHNIRYVYMGDQLGGRPNDPACYNQSGKLDYHYMHLQRVFQTGIDRLIQAHSRGLSIALLCSESKPSHCHRSGIVGRALSEHLIFLQHIDELGNLKDQREIIPATPLIHHHPMPTLFA